MSEPIGYVVHGLKELESLLSHLPGRLGTTVIAKALADAAKLGKAALKDEAAKHDDRGEIRVNLRTLKARVRHLSDSAITVHRAYANNVQFVTVGFAWPDGAAGWLVEHGHRMVTGGTIARSSGKTPKSKRGMTGRGTVVGQVPPHPIAAPAFDSVVGQMKEAFTSGVAARAEQECLDLAR